MIEIFETLTDYKFNYSKDVYFDVLKILERKIELKFKNQIEHKLQKKIKNIFFSLKNKWKKLKGGNSRTKFKDFLRNKYTIFNVEECFFENHDILKFNILLKNEIDFLKNKVKFDFQ